MNKVWKRKLKSGQIWRSLETGVEWKITQTLGGVVINSGDSGYVTGMYKKSVVDIGGSDWEEILDKADSFNTLYTKLTS